MHNYLLTVPLHNQTYPKSVTICPTNVPFVPTSASVSLTSCSIAFFCERLSVMCTAGLLLRDRSAASVIARDAAAGGMAGALSLLRCGGPAFLVCGCNFFWCICCSWRCRSCLWLSNCCAGMSFWGFANCRSTSASSSSCTDLENNSDMKSSSSCLVVCLRPSSPIQRET